MATSDTPRVLTEILDGDRLTLSQAARLLPASRGEGRRSPATLWRHGHDGAKAQDGNRVKLEMVKCGMSWCTSRAALERFVVALTCADTAATIPPRSPAARSRASAAASAKLQTMGA